MKLQLLTILIFLTGMNGTLLKAQSYQEIIVPFYTESVRIAYNPDMLERSSPKLDDEALTNYFHERSTTSYDTFLGSIRKVADVFQLNDWMYYQLLGKALQDIYGKDKTTEVELNKWFFLSQSGFDTRLGYLNGSVYVFVHTQEEVFETPMIKDKGRTFINLTNIGNGQTHQEPLYLLNFAPNLQGKPFSFHLSSLPTLRPSPKKLSVEFLLYGQPKSLELEVDQNIKAIMDNYPILSENDYMDIPFSRQLSESLIPQLQEYIAGKSDWEAVRILAAFTRSAFKYKEDKEYFGVSKPMAAEELFLHSYSDCEDRSALFYNLVKSLLDLPMVVIAYSNHLTIGVSLPQTKPGAFFHQGKAYYICDPTGPVASSQIGVPPPGYEKAPFKILMSSK